MSLTLFLDCAHLEKMMGAKVEMEVVIEMVLDATGKVD